MGLLCCLLLSLSANAGHYPVFGQDRIHGAGLLEDHSDALERWLRLGIEDAVLINIDAHDDLRWIPADKIEELRHLVRKGDRKSIALANSAGDQGLYHPGSFIFAACRLGMVGKVYWVIPFAYFQGQNPSEDLDAFLASYGFGDRCIETFSLHNGCYQGIYAGIELTICGIEHLPQVDEPVILSIDADFFPPFASWYGRDVLSAMSVFSSAMAEKSYRIQDAFVACSVNGGFLSAARRWIAGHCMEMLDHRQGIGGPYPEAWLVHNLADTYYMKGNAAALLDLTRRYRKRFARDPCLRAYQAFALQALGDSQGAFELASGLASLDVRYAFVLADLGQIRLDQGQVEAALPYFRAAYQAHPDMNYRQKNLGDALMAEGRFRQALRYYEMYRQKNGSFPVSFAMGLAALRLGNDPQAGISFGQGVSDLKEERYPFQLSEIDEVAIERAVSFFEQTDQQDAVRTITSHPCLNHLFGSSEADKSGHHHQ
jgi:hypothetical protein